METDSSRRPLRVAVLVPEVLPRWIRNSDLIQNRTLLGLGAWTELEMVPLPSAPRGAIAAIGPLTLARAATWLERRGLGAMHPVWAAVEGTAWVTRPIDADVVLGHGLFPVYAPWVRMRPPLVWGPGYDPTVSPERTARAADGRFRRRLAHTKIAFLTNRASADALRTDLDLPAERVRVLPIFETHLPRSELGEARPAERGPLRVLFVGREARRKNLPRVLEAVKRLRAEGLALSLTVVSDFRDGAIAIDTGSAMMVSELSEVEVYETMRRHDVLCVPSIAESYGMVYIEALAAGLAVVARDGAVQRAMLEDGARYADPASVEAIAAALRDLADVTRRARQTEAGLALYRARYAPDVVARAFEEALRSAVPLHR